MLRHHGDLFLTADRKNRVERARLDKQLRGIDKDCARHEFCIERQKKTLVTKWRGVSMTTGHSEKALPPDGPHDNVYENCKYNNYKLSEKRLMEWKVRERQLEKFLRQFKPRPRTCPSTMKPRPSSSRPERMTSRPDEGEEGSAMTSARSKMTGRGRIRSARAVLQEDRSMSRKRCSSVVSFSSRTEVISLGEETDRLSVAEEEHVLGDVDGNGFPDPVSNGLHAIRSGLRSLSATTLHHPQHDPDSIRRASPSPKLRFNEEILDGSAHPPLGTTLSTTQATQKLKSRAKHYEAFVRAQSANEVKFFVTKNNVVMTNAMQQTCKELHVADSTADGTDTDTGKGDGRPRSAHKTSQAHSADKMSVSSLSSEDLVDNVFLGSDITPVHDSSHRVGRDSTAGLDNETTHFSDDIAGDLIQSVGDPNEMNALSDGQTERSSNTSVQCSHRNSGVAGQSAISTESGLIDNRDNHAVNCQSVLAQLAVKDFPKTTDQPAGQVQSVSIPMKKLNIMDNQTSRVDKESLSPAVVNSRRHSSQLLPRHRTTSTDSSTSYTRRHSLQVRKDGSEQSPKTSLIKRQQSSTALLRNHTSPSAKMTPSLITSAMKVTPLLAKGNLHSEVSSHKQGSNSSQSAAASQTKRQQHRPNTPADINASSAIQQTRETHHSRNASHTSEQDDDVEISSNADDRQPSQWRRDLALEQPSGLSPSVSSLGTVIKAAMVFSKAARRRTLSTMVEENNVDTREVIRKERLRKLQSRASVLSKIMSQFPVHGDE